MGKNNKNVVEYKETFESVMKTNSKAVYEELKEYCKEREKCCNVIDFLKKKRESISDDECYKVEKSEYLRSLIEEENARLEVLTEVSNRTHNLLSSIFHYE